MIVTLSRMRNIAREYHRAKCDVILCHGVFDILHIGHIVYLEKACCLASVLFVTITPDKFVDKGEGRPAFPEKIRARVVDAIGVVGFVAINKWADAVNTIEMIKPDYYAKGGEYEGHKTNALLREEAAIEGVGGKMVYIHDDLRGSSTELWRKYVQRI